MAIDVKAVQLKKYIPLGLKELLIIGDEETEGLISKVIIEDNGMYKIDFFNRDVLLALILVREYTNLDLNKIDQDTIIDDIFESGLMEIIINEVPDAKMFIKMFEKNLTQELEIHNSVSGVVARGLEKLIDKIPDIDAKQMDKWVKAIPKAFAKLTQEDRTLLKAAIPAAIKQ